MWVALGVFLFSMLGLAASLSPAAKAARKQASRQRQDGEIPPGSYCTKHVIRKPMAPGGPERMVWVYGTHRTQGNQCDGGLHRRVSGWW